MELERKEFLRLCMPSVINGDTKNVVSPEIELLPNDLCIYQGNKYIIKSSQSNDKILLIIK